MMPDSRSLTLFPRLGVAAATLIATGCSSDRPTEPGEDKQMAAVTRFPGLRRPSGWKKMR